MSVTVENGGERKKKNSQREEGGENNQVGTCSGISSACVCAGGYLTTGSN